MSPRGAKNLFLVKTTSRKLLKKRPLCRAPKSPRTALKTSRVIYVLTYFVLIDVGHDGASFVVILFVDKKTIWVYKMGNRPQFLSNGVTDPTHFIGPVRSGMLLHLVDLKQNTLIPAKVIRVRGAIWENSSYLGSKRMPDSNSSCPTV